jgi:hypothetical protein
MLPGMSGEEIEGVHIGDACPAAIDVLSTAMSRDGEWLVLSGGGSTARCWAAGADAPAGVPLVRQRDHGGVVALALAPLPGGDLVLARSDEDELWRWDRTTGQPAGAPVSLDVPRTISLIRPFAVIETDDGPMAAANASGGGLGRWDPVTGVAAGGAFGLDAGPVRTLATAVMPDGALVVVSGGADRLLRRWDLAWCACSTLEERSTAGTLLPANRWASRSGRAGSRAGSSRCAPGAWRSSRPATRRSL